MTDHDLSGFVEEIILLHFLGRFRPNSPPVAHQFQFVRGKFRLLADMFDHLLHFFGGDERVLQTHRLAGAGRQEQHVAVPDQLLRPVHVEDHLGVRAGGHLVGDPGGEVGLDQAGQNIHRWALSGDDQVNPHCTGHLGQAGNRLLHFPGSGQDQVGQLIDDHHDIRQPAHPFLLFPARFEFFNLAVIGNDIAHAQAGQGVVAFFHLIDHAAQHQHGILRVGNHNLIQFRADRQVMFFQLGIKGQLELLGIDHHEFHIAGRHPVENAGDQGINPHALSRPGGAGDQQVGHPSQVGTEHFPTDSFAHSQAELAVMLGKFFRTHDRFEIDRRGPAVGNFDPDRRFPGNWRDHPDPLGPHRQREVISQTDHLVDLDPFGRADCVECNHRAFDHLLDEGFDIKLGQGILQQVGVGHQLFPGDLVLSFIFIQDIDRRHLVGPHRRLDRLIVIKIILIRQFDDQLILIIIRETRRRPGRILWRYQ